MVFGTRSRTRRARAVKGFFDDHPRFLDTSTTASQPTRLNLRHEALITANADLLRGARVLDLASHDGRWTMAALEAGAAHVTGVEARPDLVAHARKTLHSYGAAPENYDFITGDVFEVLAKPDLEVDVVQCFGFLYHTLRYPDLLSGLAKIAAPWLLLDTKVFPSKHRVIRVGVDDISNEGQAAEDAHTAGTKTLVGSPSQGALRMMLRTYGYDRETEFDWSSLVDRYGEEAVQAYANGERVTYYRHTSPQDVHRRVVPALADGDRRAAHLDAEVVDVAHHFEPASRAACFRQPCPHRLGQERTGQTVVVMPPARANADERRQRRGTVARPPCRRRPIRARGRSAPGGPLAGRCRGRSRCSGPAREGVVGWKVSSRRAKCGRRGRGRRRRPVGPADDAVVVLRLVVAARRRGCRAGCTRRAAARATRDRVQQRFELEGELLAAEGIELDDQHVGSRRWARSRMMRGREHPAPHRRFGSWLTSSKSRVVAERWQVDERTPAGPACPPAGGPRSAAPRRTARPAPASASERTRWPSPRACWQ